MGLGKAAGNNEATRNVESDLLVAPENDEKGFIMSTAVDKPTWSRGFDTSICGFQQLVRRLRNRHWDGWAFVKRQLQVNIPLLPHERALP